MSPPPAPLAWLTVGNHRVATYQAGEELDPAVSPRPFLHPVTTLDGVPVTDCQPADHRWHLGVSFAVQDVAPTGGSSANLWGGRTYVREQGYQWLDDHGRMQHVDWIERGSSLLTHHLAWVTRNGRTLVRELRSLQASPRARGWTLDWTSLLHAGETAAVVLGSPATNGRTGAGYGGFFWRMPLPAGTVDVFTPDARGEQQVHGCRAAWLAFSGDAGDQRRPYTLVFVPGDTLTAADPWFVRVEGYPGVGSALAFDEVLVLRPDEPQRRHIRVHVVDGRLDHDIVATLVASSSTVDS
jgi:hypothetical protein